MKGPRYCSPRINSTYLKPPPVNRQKTPASKSVSTLRKDKVVLSPRIAEVGKYAEMAKALPDVRQDKIDSIKKQIESGTYKVSPESVAKSMIEAMKKTP